MGHSSLMVQLEYDRVKRNADVPHPDLTRPKIVYKRSENIRKPSSNITHGLTLTGFTRNCNICTLGQSRLANTRLEELGPESRLVWPRADGN